MRWPDLWAFVRRYFRSYGLAGMTSGRRAVTRMPRAWRPAILRGLLVISLTDFTPSESSMWAATL